MPVYLPSNPPFAEDSPHVSGDKGALTLAVRNDSGTVLAGTTGDYIPFTTDASGNLRTTATATIAGGTKTFTDAYANPTDNIDVIALTGGFNGTTWDRVRAAANNADAVATTTLGNMTTVGYLYGFNGTTWDRLRAFGDNADAETVATVGDLQTKSRSYVFNGTTWDRWRSAPGVTGAGAVGGPTASDGALAVAPVTVGGRASNAAPTAVSTDGDVVNNWLTLNGTQRVYASRRRRTGLYYANLGNTTITAAADGATVGRFWLVNNTGSTVFGALRKVYYTMTTTTGLLTISSPSFTVERITFTGTPSGASITPAKRDSSDATASLTIRTASTGMTITAGAAAHGFQVTAALATTSNAAAPQIFPFTNDEDEYLILRAGEGIVIRQATAGTVADTRIANFDIQWEEFNSTDFAVRD